MAGLWDYAGDYWDRYKDQVRQGATNWAARPNLWNPSLAKSLNPVGPFIDMAAEYAGPYLDPLAQHQNRMYESVTGQPGQLRGEHIAGPLLGVLGRGRLPDVGKTGFYSPASRALQKAQTKGTGQQYVAALKKEPGAVAEAKEQGLIAALEDAPGVLTREHVLSMWNPLELAETVKGGSTAAPDLLDAKEHFGFSDYHWERLGPAGQTDYLEEMLSEEGFNEQATKYGSDENLNLPGGTNAKEILVQLPESSEAEIESAKQELNEYWNYLKQKYDLNPLQTPMAAEGRYAEMVNMPESEINEYKRLFQKMDSVRGQDYTAGHWDEPNVLAHIRTNERDVGGKKALHIEEIQSDWHQQGQKKGYNVFPKITKGRPEDIGPLKIEEFAGDMYVSIPIGDNVSRSLARIENGVLILNSAPGVTNELGRFQNNQEALEVFKNTDLYVHDATFPEIGETTAIYSDLESAQGSSTSHGVPDAPFKKNWHELAFKRALTEAVNDPSIERLTWTTGAVQADRYRLSKYIDSIEAIPAPSSMTEGRTVYDLAVQYKEGEVKNLRAVPPESLADYVGKEMAEKIVQDADTVPSQRFYLTNKNAPIDPLGEQRIDPSTGFATKEEGLRYLENNNMAGDFEIREGVVKEGGVKIYSGLDLEVGGEFHKQFYDKKITKFAKKFLKKYGVEPQRISSEITNFDVSRDWGISRHGNGYAVVQPGYDPIVFPTLEAAQEKLRELENLKPHNLWYIDITPEMREEIMTKGVPLTQRRQPIGLMPAYA